MFLVIALVGFLVIAGLGWVLTSPSGSQARANKRMAVITAGPQRERTRAKSQSNTADTRRKQLLKTLRDNDKKQRKASLTTQARIQQAGLTITPRTFWIISGAVGVTVMLLIIILGQSPLIGLGLSFAAGFGLPRWVIGFLAKRRTKKFVESFADALDIIVRGIKSGLPVNDNLKVIAAESSEPLAGEFKRLTENLGMGMSFDQALEKMYERMPINEVRFFAIVISIQQKTGGNLAEALGNLSSVLRSRKLMGEKIKALSSEAIASASIIGVLPPGVITLISFTNPAYLEPMFKTSLGHLLLLVGAGMMGLGIFVMRKMINFKF